MFGAARRGRTGEDGAGFDPRWLVLGVTTIGSFMSILDSTIVNVALPDVLRDFHADLASGQFVLTAYLLSLAIVVPLSGFLGDRFGLKSIYLVTLVCFTAGSALCGLAWNLPSLVAFRTVQGLGGGMLQPVGMAIVYSLITPLERGRFMTILGLPMLLAPLLGPTVGGYLAQYVSWRMIFLINLPIGAINVVLAWRLLHHGSRRMEARFDRAGFGLSLLAFPALLLALSLGVDVGWNALLVGAALVGVVALVMFVVVELRKHDPLLQLRLFVSPIFSLAMGLNFVMQFALFGIQFLLPLYLQQARGLGAAATGLILLPSGVTSFIFMNVGGRLYNRLGPRPLTLSGLVVMVVATALLSRVTATTSLVLITVLASMRGVAMGLCMMPVQTAAYNTVPTKWMGRATSLTNVLFRIYGSASTAALTAVLIISLRLRGAPAGATVTSGTAPAGLLAGAFDDGFLAMAILSLIGIVPALFLRDRAVEALLAGRESPVEELALAAE
jgi:EmrB/QacA subfamily drug resistance transporter